MTTKQRSALVIKHVAFEDLGNFEPVLLDAGFGVTYLNAGPDDLASIGSSDADLLIIMGGPVSVNDVADYPFLQQEIDLLRQRIRADKPTLGICLGAQLIAKAMGANIYSGPQKEIGWFPLILSTAGEASALSHLQADGVAVLHWHGETFDLPDGAALLASTGLYPNQAFSVGKTLALQFHPEVTARGLEQWFIGHTGEINQTEGISVARLREDTARYADPLEKQATALLRDWLDHVMP